MNHDLTYLDGQPFSTTYIKGNSAPAPVIYKQFHGHISLGPTIKVSEIVVHFKPSPHRLFSEHEGGTGEGNQLVIRIQPDEGILLKFGMKVQGAGFKVQEANLDFYYKDLINSRIPGAYQRLLLDCMQGDSTLYTRGDAVEAAWRFLDPVLAAWKDDKSIPLHGYPCGTWGPEIADQMIEGEEYSWRCPSKNLADDGLYCEL